MPVINGGLTTLKWASDEAYLEVLKPFLWQGADIHADPAFDGGRTALQSAAGCGNPEVAIA